MTATPTIPALYYYHVLKWGEQATPGRLTPTPDHIRYVTQMKIGTRTCARGHHP